MFKNYFNFSRHQKGFLLSGIFVLAICLRLYRIDAPSLWQDEIMTAGRVSTDIPTLIKGLTHTPFTILHYLVTYFFVHIFKLNEFNLRLPSMIFSSLSILVICELGEILFDRKVGILAAFLLSISAYDINYAQEAKMYSMMWFFILLSFCYFFKWLLTDRFRWLFIYLLSTIALLYTSYEGFIFLILQNLIFAIYFERKKCLRWLGSQGLLFLAILPLFCQIFFNPVHSIFIDWISKKSVFIFFKMLWSYAILNLWPTLCDNQNTYLLLIKAVESLIYLGLILSVFLDMPWRSYFQRTGSKNLKSGILLILLTVIPCLIFVIIDKLYHPVLVYRYLGFIHLPLIILFAKALMDFKPFVRCLLVVFITVNAFCLSLFPYYSNQLKISNQDWRAVGQFLNKQRFKGTVVKIEVGISTNPVFLQGISLYMNNVSQLQDYQIFHIKKYKTLYLVFDSVQPRPVKIDNFTKIHTFYFTRLIVLEFKRKT